jgi:pimeloyl-ACP methyl ester carboxylesterase
MNLLGFVRADRLKDETGIRMPDPYEPGKIPVIFVHGLLSSPLTWAPLFNELRGDPFLRDHFQFWACYYPTGHPFFGSAAELRAELSRLRSDLDPDHRDAAFEHMVLIGHSMGGLVSKLITQNGGPDLWRAVSATPFDELDLSPALREKLRETLFFQREGGVTRVIFIATPHHGACLSQSAAGWLGTHLVHFRADLEDFAKEIAQRIPDSVYGHVPTSIELLAPDSRALRILAARPAPPGVHYHSVIGVEPKTWHLLGPAEPGDGVVAYRSAHLEGVESELVVPANHFTVHQHQETVEEIRRILIEHLATMPSFEATAASPIGFNP